MSGQNCETTGQTSASAVLERLLAALPQDRVSVGWIYGELHEHSFELLAFVMALVGILPGASIVIGVLMIVPAMGMTFSSGMPLPEIVARRSIPTRQASYVLGRAISLLHSRTAAKRGAHRTTWKIARPVAGVLSFVLGITLLVPVPLSNVIPALTIAGLSLAAFEGNLTLLCLSGLAAAGSLAITGATLVVASQAIASFGL